MFLFSYKIFFIQISLSEILNEEFGNLWSFIVEFEDFTSLLLHLLVNE